MAKGDNTAPAPAPGWLDPLTGSVKVPEKWEHMLQRALADVRSSDAREEAEEQQQRLEQRQKQQQGGSGGKVS